MRILLIAAYLGRRELRGPVFPLGIAYLSATLSKNKYEVQLFDPNIEENPYEGIREKIKKFSPDVVGISQRNMDTTQRLDPFCYYSSLSPTLKLIRSIAPKTKIVVGGSGFSMFAPQVMEQNPEIDFGVFLEGEETFPALLENLDTPEKVPGIFYRRNNKVYFTGIPPLPNFSNLPMPDRDSLDLSKYTTPIGSAIGIQTKRGCPLNCIYCSYPFLNGKTVRIRTPAHVVDEMELLYDKYGVKTVFIVDGVFNVPLDHAIGICNEIIRRKLKIKWNAWFDLAHFNEEFLQLCLEAGCTDFGFSPDAVTDQGLAALGKSITHEDLKRAFTLARKYKNAKFGFALFVNPPGENFVGLLKTICFFLKGTILLKNHGGVGLCWIRIEPHTKMFEIACKEKIISPDTDLLATTPTQLKKLFYINPNLKYVDFLIVLFMKVLESLAKFKR